VPYLRNYLTEEQIYSSQLGDTVMGKHAAPHAYAVAAQWAVLTRMRRPRPELYPEGVKEAVAGLNPMEKADLYALGLAPAEARFEVAKALEQSIEALAAEYSDQLDYEGDTGASAREIRTALLNAAQLPYQECLTPVAVLGELGDLSRQTALYEFLHVQSDNGYGDAENLLRLVAQRYASTLDREFRAAMGLVTEGEFERLLQRYAAHASAWLKGESVSEGPGKPAGKPDEQYMRGLEERWGRSGEAAATRQEFMGRIASFGLEHPGVALPYGRIFREQIELLARSYYAENRPEVESRLMSVLEMLHGGAVEEADRAQNLAVIEAMKSRYGYCDHCLVSALGYLASLLRE
jgi:predicted Ser/Thr protein kinase